MLTSRINQIIDYAKSFGLDLSKLTAEMTLAEWEGKLAFNRYSEAHHSSPLDEMTSYEGDYYNAELVLTRNVLRFNVS